MSERIPERLVRVDYELPSSPTLGTVYFDDHGEETSDRYEAALQVIYPDARCKSIVRNVKPTSDGSCA